MNAQHTEKRVRIAARLYEAREVTRRMLGDRYPDRMKEYSAVVAEVAANMKIDVLVAAKQIAEALTKAGNDLSAMMVVAAAVEMIEPSPGIVVSAVGAHEPGELAGDAAAPPAPAAADEGVSPVTVELAMKVASQPGPLDTAHARQALLTLRDEVMFRWEQRTALSFRLQELRTIAAEAGLARDSKLYLAIHDATATAEAWMHPRTLSEAVQGHIDGLKRRIAVLEQTGAGAEGQGHE